MADCSFSYWLRSNDVGIEAESGRGGELSMSSSSIYSSTFCETLSGALVA